MDPRSHSSEACAKIILLTGFLVSIFGVFLVDSFGLLRQPHEPRDREVMAPLRASQAPTVSNLCDGSWAKEIRHTLPQASLVGRELRPLYRSVTLGLLQETPDDVVLGRDGWLFYGPTIQPVPREALDPLVGLISEAVQRGVKVSLVLVPSKVAIYPEMLRSPPQRPIADRTDEILSLCRRNSIPTIDLRPLLMSAKAIADEPLYHPTDTHTTTCGALVIARAIAEQIFRADRAHSEGAQGGILARRSEPTRSFPGDLHVMLDLPPQSWMSEVYFTSFRKPPVLDEIPISEAADQLWLGDSFSRYHEAFLPRACALLSGWPAVEFHSYAPDYDARIRARLSAPNKPRHLMICLAARWF